jgi:hypothetical protein
MYQLRHLRSDHRVSAFIFVMVVTLTVAVGVHALQSYITRENALSAAETPSGQGVPPDPPGWARVFVENFSTPAPRGSFPGPAYRDRWTVYADGWEDTSGHGTYMPSKVLSVHDGVLDYWLRTKGDRHLVAAALPRMDAGVYGRYSVRFKADPIRGYKTAWLLWPDSGRSPDHGEIDWPEGLLNARMSAFMHFARPDGGQHEFRSRARYTAWHTATIVWKRDLVRFLLDGRTIGVSRKFVPANPMHWVLQTETSTSGPRPPKSAEGHVLVDWAVAWRPAKR